MSIYVYPAVFHPEEGGEYSVGSPICRAALLPAPASRKP